MGSGTTAYRIALGEALAIQEHQLAMIPIMKEQAESMIPVMKEQAAAGLEIREKEFALELQQTKEMNLLSQQLQPAPILVPAGIAQAEPGPTNNLVYAGLAALAYFLLRKMKWL